MLSPDIFRELQDLSGRQFTLDACCNDNGSNALVSKYCSQANSFLETDVQGEHIWLNPPFNQLREFISHYLQCKAKAPHTTSACILVPKWRGPHTRLLKRMQLIREFPVGTQLFSAPSSDGTARQQLPGIPWPVQVFYDAPLPRLHALRSDNQLTMQFSNARVQGANATLVMDSAASDNFLDLDWARRNGLRIKRAPRQVELGDGRTVDALGQCKVRFQVGNFADTVSCWLMQLAPGMDLILASEKSGR